MPDFEFELSSPTPTAGVDEAGRGPWAGPVVAAAAVLSPALFPTDLSKAIKDSKKLSKNKRETLFEVLTQLPSTIFYYHIASASVEEIDQFNILKATMLAMKRSLEGLSTPPQKALIDGIHCPHMPYPCQGIIQGDDKSLSIAAASILAKVTRDRLMNELSLIYPHYGWDQNAGYGTKQHQEALKIYGITPHHRKSFKPIAVLSTIHP